MKKILFSKKELKLNDGGESEFPCPNCGEKLRKHISGRERYFCMYCRSFYERTKPRFVPISKREFIKKYFGGSKEAYEKFKKLKVGGKVKAKLDNGGSLEVERLKDV